jgi:hypothetical protein
MSRRLWILASAAILAVCVAPFALAAGEGKPISGGARNPSTDASQSYSRETGIIANTSTYGTRQSNKSDNGGGAIYGCRSGEGGTAKGNEPCIRANNLSKGLAFEFASDGTTGGAITVGNGGDTTKPFTTNATGVADGLNADRVDGKNASDVVADAQAQNHFAQVSATGALGASRGVASATRDSLGSYTVAFSDDVSKCGITVSESSFDADNGAAAFEVGSGGKNVHVKTRSGGGPDGNGPTAVADEPFHIVAIC